MMTNGSIESIDMDKSVLSSDTEYDIYDTKNQKLTDYTNPEKENYNDILSDKYKEYKHAKDGATSTATKPPKVYGLPEYDTPGFELSYRNDGFRDNSTYSGTRNNSVGTVLNDESPIIHHTDPDDGSGSDYYGNSSTLPLRGRNDNLSFLSELKNRLPEYEPLEKQSPGHSSFHPQRQSGTPSDISSNSLPFDKKVDKLNFTPVEHPYHVPEIRRPDAFKSPSPQDIRRPDSYYTAVRSSKQPPPVPVAYRPKPIYESSNETNRPNTYSRSKSEALLETNFDEEVFDPTPITADSRSYSQPLETAM